MAQPDPTAETPAAPAAAAPQKPKPETAAAAPAKPKIEAAAPKAKPPVAASAAAPAKPKPEAAAATSAPTPPQAESQPAAAAPIAAPPKVEPEITAAAPPAVAAPQAEPEITVAGAETVIASIVKLDPPEAVRVFAEKGLAEAKDAYAKLKTAADETSDMVEVTYSTASNGASTLGLKVLETARTNANAAFDHALALMAVKTLADAIELNSMFLRRQTETATQQAEEFGELARKFANETMAPVKARFEKTFRFTA